MEELHFAVNGSQRVLGRICVDCLDVRRLYALVGSGSSREYGVVDDLYFVPGVGTTGHESESVLLVSQSDIGVESVE